VRVRGKIHLRPCTPDDVEIVADIVRRSYSTQPLAQIPAEMPIYHAEYHEEAMLDPQTRWWLLYDDASPVGVAMWRALPGLAHLHLLFVVAERQGHGCGSLLLKHFQEESARADAGLRLLTLHCLSDALRTLRFYKRHGYVAYSDGDEGHVVDLYLWLDAARRHDASWPLKKDKMLLYKLLR
jgi:GNAT superfamily N-acetyltransferase